MTLDFRARLLRGDRLLGTLVSIPSPDVVEILARSGLDWLFIDGEHGPFGPAETVTALRAAAGVPCLVRVPSSHPAAIAHALDAGAAGIIVPQVHSGAQAAEVARLAHYPPAGTRGLGIGRGNGYGSEAREGLRTANDRIVVVVQAESAGAVGDIDAIAGAPGIDAVLVGPHDLAASLGRVGEPEHPEVQAAIAHVVERCRAAGRTVGIFGAEPAAVQPWMERGVTLVVAGVDALLLSGAAARVVAALRG